VQLSFSIGFRRTGWDRRVLVAAARRGRVTVMAAESADREMVSPAPAGEEFQAAAACGGC